MELTITEEQKSNEIRLGRRRDLGIKRKAALLFGYFKMELVHSDGVWIRTN